MHPCGARAFEWLPLGASVSGVNWLLRGAASPSKGKKGNGRKDACHFPLSAYISLLALLSETMSFTFRMCTSNTEERNLHACWASVWCLGIVALLLFPKTLVRGADPLVRGANPQVTFTFATESVGLHGLHRCGGLRVCPLFGDRQVRIVA